jgi:hypothetical protein
MRKLATWLLVTLGVAAVARRLRRRRAAPAAAPAAGQPPSSDPAEELRRKLAESRTPGAATEVVPEATVADRRAGVHEEGHAALDEMRARAGD